MATVSKQKTGTIWNFLINKSTHSAFYYTSNIKTLTADNIGWTVKV